MKLRLETFKPEHIQNIPKDERESLGLSEFWLEKAQTVVKRGPCYTAFAEDKVIAACGVNVMWDGVGEAWAITTPLVFKYPLFFHKSVKNILDNIIAQNNLHRVQSTVNEGFSKGCKWLESLGFKCEGLMRQYDFERSNHYLYAKVV